MNRDRLKKNLIGIGKDVLVAFTIVCIVMLSIYAYCGIWPPMVVVESGSMQRYDDRSVVGVIDTGDMVFVKKVGDAGKLITYVEGEATDYSKYGTYGDVIIYRPNGLSERGDGTPVIPIIHRLVVWIELNETAVNPNFQGIDYGNMTFDVPSLGLFGTSEVIVLENYGFWKDTVRINLAALIDYFNQTSKVPHGGFITMGDNNVPWYDQPMSGGYEPILPEWIVGKAIGEIPWFGLIKLKVTGANLAGVPRNSWTSLYVTLFMLLLVPFLLDILGPRFMKVMRERKGKDEKGLAETDQITKSAAEPKDTGPPAPEPAEGTGPSPGEDNSEILRK